MSALRTPLYDRHLSLGAKVVEFAGWEMPIQYATGIVEEHLQTRREAGLFDVSHMGRFGVRGPGALAFLDASLTNDARALAPGKAQYTLVPTDSGGVLDDAFLYHVAHEEYLLVVNAGNRSRDWERLREGASGFRGVTLEDRSEELAMISVQGPRSPEVLEGVHGGPLPEGVRTSARNTVWRLSLAGAPAVAVRTGYAGEPLGFELMLPARVAGELWDLLVHSGATPVGLGARDTLRLEAGLPLHGHELGQSADGSEIPAFACAQARLAVSLASHKEAVRGRAALALQEAAWRRIRSGDRGGADVLPRLVRQMTLLEPGVARSGARILDAEGSQIGLVTSGTVVPVWVFQGAGQAAHRTEVSGKRAALLGLVDSSVGVGQSVGVEVRGKVLPGLVVSRLLDARVPPYAQPVTFGR